MSKLYIKNMVCDRCRMAVGQTLEQLGLHPLRIDLGEAVVEEKPSLTSWLPLGTNWNGLGSGSLMTAGCRP